MARARAIAESLADLGFRTRVVSDREPRSASPLPPAIDDLTVLDRRLRFGWSLELAREIRSHAADADVVIVASALLLPAVWTARPEIPVIWDTDECETLHYSRLPRTVNTRARALAWRNIERWAIRHSDVAVAISETEAAWWLKLFPAIEPKLVVVNHRAIARPISPDEARRYLARLCGDRHKRPALLFVGNVLGKHNAVAAEWLVREFAPRLRGDTSLILAGPGTDSIESLGEQTSNVVLLGEVPDIDSVIAGADLCLAPLAAGAGVKTKILHYLAHGKRIVATPVATEGLEGAPGMWTAHLGDFIDVVDRLLASDEPAEIARAREHEQQVWLERHHGRAAITAQWHRALRLAGVVAP